MDLTQVRAVLFDLDGTLIDTAPDIAHAVDAVFHELGRPAPGEAQVRLWVGNGVRQLLVRALTGGAEEIGAQAEWLGPAEERFKVHYAARLYQDSRPYPHVVDTVQRLHAAGYQLGIVTNKPHDYSRTIVDATGLTQELPVVVGGDSTPHKKPHPAPMEKALKDLDVPAEHALMVGDSIADVRTARALEMPVMCVPYGYTQGLAPEELGADRLLRDFGELLSVLPVQAFAAHE